MPVIIEFSRCISTYSSAKFELLKNKLGKIPDILDFYEYGEVDPMLFINYAKTYHNFIKMVDVDYTIRFNAEEEAMLEFISSLLVGGERPHELLMLEMLTKNQAISEQEFVVEFEKIDNGFRTVDYHSAINVLRKDFINTQSEKKRYEKIQFFDMEENGKRHLRRALSFCKTLSEINFKKEFNNLIQYGLRKYNDLYREHEEDNLVLYQKYSRKDVCRLLDWSRDDSSTIYGYKIKNKTCPIFVTYDKKSDIASSTKYEDQFLNNKVFSWMTRSRVSINSTEAQEFIHCKENKLTLYLFIKKSDGEGADFYYMGKVLPIGWVEATIKNDSGKILPIMNFQLELQHGVRNDIYDYFTK